MRLDGLVSSTLDGACGVVEEPLLLLAGHEPEQVTGLLEVVVVVLAEVEVIRGGPDRLGGIGVVGLLGPAAEVVRFNTRNSALVAVDAHGPVAVVGVDQLGCTWIVDRDLVVVDAHPVAGCVSIGEQPSLQHLVRAERDPWDEVGRSERGLLDIGEVVVRVAVELVFANLDQRVVLLAPHLGQVEGVKPVGRGVCFGHQLDVHGPLRVVAAFDGLEEVAAVGLAVAADQFGSFGVGEIFDALLGAEVEFDPMSFAGALIRL